MDPLEHFVTAEDGGKFAGNHIIFDFWGVSSEKCMDETLIRESIVDACRKAGATILGYNFHHFGEGCGVTGVVMLSESHASIHTWPEANLMTFDVFMCGNAKPHEALRYLESIFLPTRMDIQNLRRGVIPS